MIAVDAASGRVLGFVSAVSDGVLAAYIPLLEVLPPYRQQGVGSELVRRLLDRLLEREALEVFELIRPVSEQWGFANASVAAFPSAERSGKYDVFTFSRSADGRWSTSRISAKVFNTESGHR